MLRFKSALQLNRTYPSTLFRFLSTKEDVEVWRKENKVQLIDPRSEFTPFTKFTDLQKHNLPEKLQESFKNFSTPSAIQAQSWPILLQKKDMIGVASTGSGKSLAFMIPAIQQVLENPTNSNNSPRAVILVPTRELCQQVHEVTENFTQYLDQEINTCAVFGGASRYKQEQEIENGCDILIGTVGRVLDFLESDVIDFSEVNYFVLDEADRMLDMGFKRDMESIISYLPKNRQTAMFSATMKSKNTQDIAHKILNKQNCKLLTIDSDGLELKANCDIEQNIIITNDRDKLDQFVKIMNTIGKNSKVLIFMKTKKSCDFFSYKFTQAGFPAEAIHGDKSQHMRKQYLDDFRSGDTKILIATDVASRGLDIDGVDFVINFDFPNEVDDYVHRIGRTGRAGRKGVSYSFLTNRDSKNVKELIEVLERSDQEVSDDLRKMARTY